MPNDCEKNLKIQRNYLHKLANGLHKFLSQYWERNVVVTIYQCYYSLWRYSTLIIHQDMHIKIKHTREFYHFSSHVVQRKADVLLPDIATSILVTAKAAVKYIMQSLEQHAGSSVR